MSGVTRRALLGAAPAVAAGAAVVAAGAEALGAEHEHSAITGTVDAKHERTHRQAHAAFRGKVVDHDFNGFTPRELLRDFERGKTRTLPDGTVLREFDLLAEDKLVEVAPGIRVPMWTYNGRIPGPTLRADEGDLVRVHFHNGSGHPHTIHFHGIHADSADGIPGLGAGTIDAGSRTTYEFTAEPFGLHLYHCHVRPLAEHIVRGLYGMLIIDPAQGREPADEMVMMMNSIDTNGDGENEFYAVNTIGFHFMHSPIKVKRGELVRIYLANMTEHDPINSLHIHANFFDYIPTGTALKGLEFTDIVMQCQGQRGILELRFPKAGRFMFHAHQSEFTELGWVGFFEVS